jgi:chromosome segregation ATPase
MLQKCCFFTSCFKKEPLLDNQFSGLREGNQYQQDNSNYLIEIENLEKLLKESRTLNETYEKNISDLQHKLNNIEPKVVIENIKSCKRVSNCNHETCDYEPMIKSIRELRSNYDQLKTEYTELLHEHTHNTETNNKKIMNLQHVCNTHRKRLENKDQIILELNNQIMHDEKKIRSQQNSIHVYKIKCEKLEDEINNIKQDNNYLYKSRQRYKEKTSKLTQKLSSVPEDHVLEDTASMSLPQSDKYSPVYISHEK